MLSVQVAQALRTSRRRMILAQRELAAVVGVPPRDLARWESGDLTGPLATLSEALARLGCAVQITAAPRACDSAVDGATTRLLGRAPAEGSTGGGMPAHLTIAGSGTDRLHRVDVVPAHDRAPGPAALVPSRPSSPMRTSSRAA